MSGMFSAIRAALQALAHRGEVADPPYPPALPVKSCPLNRVPHMCCEKPFHPDDPLAALELDASDVKVPRRFRRG